MKAVLVALLLGPAPAPAVTPPASPPAATQVTVEILRVRTAGLDTDAFARELALRLPAARIVGHDADPATTPGFTVFVDVQRDGSSAWALTLVASDGRAYDRRVAADASSSADDVVRLLAGNVGNLVAAIEAGTVAHDRNDVPIPAPAVATPACPACPQPKPPAPCPEPTITTAATAAPPAVLELGLGIAPSLAIGLGEPDDADRFTAAGGDVALWLRHRSGALVGAEVRVLGRKLAFDTSIARTRIGIGVGYAWRRGSFELTSTAAIGIEPWSVRVAGSRSDLGDTEGEARTGAPLLGGGIRIVPAHRFEIGGVGVRIGPRVEVAASSAIGDGGRVAQLFVDDGGALTSIGRIGGWELGVGVDVVVWIPLRSKRLARRGRRP